MGCHGHGYPEKKGKVKCPPDCLGDLTQMAREWAKKLGDGKEIFYLSADNKLMAALKVVVHKHIEKRYARMESVEAAAARKGAGAEGGAENPPASE